MRYRIKKISYRNEETGEIKSYFQPQYFYDEDHSFLGHKWNNSGWNDCFYKSADETGSYTRRIHFITKEGAMQYIKNMHKEVPPDECVYLEK